jgi:hypothetical protein
VLVLGEVEPSVVVEPGCEVELEALDDCPVPDVVDNAVEDVVEVVVAGEPSVGSSGLVPVPAPLGDAPPPLIIVDVPPVACDFSLLGAVTVVVEVVTVVGIAVDGDVATSGARVCGCNGWEATAGAASSGGSALESVTGAAVACVTWWLGGAISAGRAC